MWKIFKNTLALHVITASDSQHTYNVVLNGIPHTIIVNVQIE